MFINRYPYTDTHELNLDWIIAKMKELSIEFDEFKVVNQITFSGAWDITMQYPAWTIVSDNNIGYVSIKPVPAGVLLTNGNYWREVIDYTAQIAGLQMRVVALENTVGDSSSGLVKDVNDVEADIITINNNIDVIESREIVILGDSYGVDADAGGTSWATFVETWMSDLTIYRNTVGGTGFASDVYITDNNLSMLQALTIPDKNKVKDIVIIGGANDANLIFDGLLTESVLRTRIDAFMNYCRINFPNAVVKVAFVGWRTNSSPADKKYIETAAIYQSEIERFSNAKYYSSGESILHDVTLINTLDFVHPTQEGSNILGEFAASVINNSEFNYTKHFEYDNPTPETGYSFNGNNHWYINRDDNITELTILGEAYGNYLDIRLAIAATYSGTLAIVGNIIRVPHMVRGIYGNYGMQTIDVLCGVTGKGTKTAKALVLYQDGYLSIRIFNLQDGVNNDTIESVVLPMFRMSFPTRLN